MNMLAVLSGEMENTFVEGSEYPLIVNCQAEQVGICDLVVSVQAPEKGLGQRAPVVNTGVVVVARM